MKTNSVPTGDHVFVPSLRKTKKRQSSALELKSKPRGTGDTRTRRKNEPPEKTGGAADTKGRKKALPRGGKPGGTRDPNSRQKN